LAVRIPVPANGVHRLRRVHHLLTESWTLTSPRPIAALVAGIATSLPAMPPVHVEKVER